MNKKRVGFVLIFIGIAIFFLQPISSITGLAIASNFATIRAIWFYLVAIFCIIIGLLAIYRAVPTRAERAERLGQIIGYSWENRPDARSIDNSFRRKLDKGAKKRKFDEYYKRRAQEIFDSKYNFQDVTISRWELDGIIDFVKNAKGKLGNHLYRDVEFEHGSETPTIHMSSQDYSMGGSYSRRSRGGEVLKNRLHLNAQMFDENGSEIKRHLIITDDPQDERLKFVGIMADGRTDKSSPWGVGLDIGKRVESSYSPNHPTFDRKEYQRKIEIT